MNEDKPILAIETTENICSACLYYSDSEYFESGLLLKNSHAEKLFGIIDSVMKTSGEDVNNIKAVAVSSGPGSFTGLRIGMSAAKGIAFGAALPIIQVPTFEALALQITNYLPDGSEFAIANKVNSEEIYFAKFQIKSNNFIFVENLKIINHAELIRQAESCRIFGNSVSIIEKQLKTKFNIAAPSSVFVAKWAFNCGTENFDFDYLEPNYLKDFIIRERKK